MMLLELLTALNREKPVSVELGLQTIHEETAAFIRRGYPLSCFTEAAERLRGAGLEVVVHTILGLPGESKKDVLQTMQYLNSRDIQGIKLQLLHVLKGTDLAGYYASPGFHVLNREEYIDMVICCLESPFTGYYDTPPDGGRTKGASHSASMEYAKAGGAQPDSP